jgi:peptidoglycan hydrolase-like protein with peptidoglycan-binding domain
LSGLGQFRGRIAALGGVIVILLAAGSWMALTHASAQSTSHQAGSAPGSGHGTAASAPKTPLRVVSITPAPHARHIDGAAPVRVTFSAPLAAGSPLPTLKPAIAGNWEHVGTDALQFVPARGFSQWAHVRVHIPAGTAGVQSATGTELTHARTVHFQVGGYSTARLAEVLAQLKYLPVKWAPDSTAQPVAGQTPAGAELSAAYSPPAGTYTWKHGYPRELHKFWDGGSPSGLIVHGAVMAFESDHDLTMDGVAGSEVWATLLKAAAKDDVNTHGYSYALASQHSPETLTVWHNGKKILHTAANTGIPAAPTTVGTAPVYLRYSFQIMRGKNPDGSKYADPVKWVAYFRSGEAVHYFPRGSYGFQQSLGCVELPDAQAAFVWPYLTYGTLVTVTPA